MHNDEQPTVYINGRPLTTLDEGRVIVPLGRAVMVFPRDFTDLIRKTTAIHSDR